MNSEIISAAEVINTLVGGFEVLMIDKAKTNKYGILCIPLTTESFAGIKKIVGENNPNRIYIKTEKEIKEEKKDEK